jgi:glycine/D-amino acid oxidase-like deaminating enzyme
MRTAYDGKHVVIVGGGPGGTGAAYALNKRGVRTTILDAGYRAAAFWRNQKWLHEGLLYLLLNWLLALKLLHGQPAFLQLAGRHVLRRGGHFLSASAHTLQTLETMAHAHHFPVQRLAPQDMASSSPLGAPACVGGFLTGDAVIDFPSALEDVQRQLRHARVVRPAEVLRLLTNDHSITGVQYRDKGEVVTMSCDSCILTAGAWSLDLLRESLGVTLPAVKRWQSPVVVFKGELVEKITVSMDNGLTLVPYKGATLVANTRRASVENVTAIHSLRADMVEEIAAQLCEAFPALQWNALEVVDAYG